MSDNKQQASQSENGEQGFNDSELADIMSEIENLEKEFSSEGQAQPASSDKKEEEDSKADLQQTIDQEVEELSKEVAADPEAPAEVSEDQSSEFEELVDQKASQNEEEHDDVFNDDDFDEATAEVTTLKPVQEEVPKNAPGNIQLKASGDMHLELEFSVGKEKAQLTVLKDGFSVELNGIEVSVDQEKGCHIHMPGGAEFSIPIEAKQTKKAS